MSQTLTLPASLPENMQNLDGGEAEENDAYSELPKIPAEELRVGVNLTGYFDDVQLERLGADCKRHIEIDEASRKEWMETTDEAMNLAMQIAEKKSYPHDRASNVIYPMITTASMQFAQRAYLAVVPGDRVVNCAVIGDDSGVYHVPTNPQTGAPMAPPAQAPGPQQPPAPGQPPQQPSAPQPEMVVEPGAKAERAGRVSRHMSWQCLDLMPEWEPGIDSLLHYLPIAGCAFRKMAYDSGERRPMSSLIYGDKFIINNSAKSIAGSPRYSIKDAWYPFQIKEQMMRGDWRRCDIDGFTSLEGEADNNDDQAERIFYEHHCRLDLDDSGYEKPYIVTLHESGKVVRVERNWRAVKADGTVEPYVEYVKYSFMPNPKGGFYDVGFGWLLKNINVSVNTLINALIDAGHWQNAPTGFMGRGLRLGRAGDISLKPNTLKSVDASGEDLAKNIWIYQHPGPSLVLFQMLGLMIEAGKDISSVQDVMQGRMEQNVAPTTMMSLVEQGMTAFTAIFKRVHRSLKAEFGLLYRINAETLPAHMYAYGDILDDPNAIAGQDYNVADQDVKPVTDPKMVSDQVKQAKASVLVNFAQQGLVNPREATKRALTAMNIEDVDALLPEEAQGPSPMDQIMFQRMQLDLKKDQQEMENERIEVQIKANESLAKIKELRAKAVKALAEAEAAEDGRQMEFYRAFVETLDRASQALPAPAPPPPAPMDMPPPQNGLAGLR